VNVTVRNNTVYRNFGEGIVVSGPGPVTVANNTVYDNFSCNIYLDKAHNARIENNFVYYTGDPSFVWTALNLPPSGIQIGNEWATAGTASSDVQILNNVVVGARSAFVWGSYQEGGGLLNTLVANNTFVDGIRSVLAIDDGAHDNSRLVNNIVLQTRNAPLVELSQAAGLTFSNNLFFGGSAGIAAGQGDVYARPNFVAPGYVASGYSLADGSAGVDRGVALDAVKTDYAGSARNPPYDMGAFER
jgi:parallel beta-helix repeat protein